MWNSQMVKYFVGATLALTLGGCASMNLFKDSASTEPAPSIAAPPTGQSTPTAFTSAQIKSLLTGKSWHWKGPKNSGVTLYALDGTSLVEVTGKGTTQGKWETKDGQLCESFAPAPFLPQGVPLTCQPFTGGNGGYQVGQAVFTLAS